MYVLRIECLYLFPIPDSAAKHFQCFKICKAFTVNFEGKIKPTDQDQIQEDQNGAFEIVTFTFGVNVSEHVNPKQRCYEVPMWKN